MIRKEIWTLRESGEWFTFEPHEVRYVNVSGPKGKQRLWLVVVHAPALQRLRGQYGVKPKLNGHDFHITLGRETIQ